MNTLVSQENAVRERFQQVEREMQRYDGLEAPPQDLIDRWNAALRAKSQPQAIT